MSQQEPDVFTPFMRKVSALYRPVGLNGERFKQWADYTPLWVLIPGGVFFLALFAFVLVSAIPALRPEEWNPPGSTWEVLMLAVVSLYLSSALFLAAVLIPPCNDNDPCDGGQIASRQGASRSAML